jgi:hypothetical protein
MTKISRVCEKCCKVLPKANAYETIERPKSRLLCKDCFEKWMWEDEPI